MKFKALRHKETKEFIQIQNYGGVNMLFTADLPLPLPMSATIELIKTYHENYSPLPKEIDINDYELVEFEFYEAETIGADIRNKLTPVKNVLTLVRLYDKEKNESRKYLLKNIISREIKQSLKCIRYISKLL